jgi:hypothetical protein
MRVGGRLGVGLEFALGAATLFGFGVLVRDVFVLGYMPAPIFHDKSDTFMDWYNPAYWAHSPGAYDAWFSVYPPLSFLFIDLFSRPSCFTFSADQGRVCDPEGYLIISTFFLINIVLLWLTYRKYDRHTSIPRAVAVGLGTSMMFAWDRGNLVIPCFTCYVLAYGNLLKESWLRALLAAATVNFKPYLILSAIGRLFRRDWLWAERFGIFCFLIYIISFIIFGKGDPVQLITDTVGFSQPPVVLGYDLFEFSTTYEGLLMVLNSSFPIMHFVGSRLIEFMEIMLPLVMRVGSVGVAMCFLGALVRPAALTRTRLTALALSILFVTVRSQGGYSLIFLLFFVFFEPWRGVGRIVALIAAYVWCVPLDLDVSGLTYTTTTSFLTNRVVNVNLSITLGQLARPLLVMLIEYGLVLASFGDLIRHAQMSRKDARRSLESAGGSADASVPAAPAPS